MTEIVINIRDIEMNGQGGVSMDMEIIGFNEGESVPTTPATLTALAIKRIFDSNMVGQMVTQILPEYFENAPEKTD